MLHRRTFVTASITAAAVAWFLFESRGHDRWPGSGSLPGLTFGIVGGAIILFEAAYAVRRWLVNWQFGSRSAWLREHVQLGLLGLPLIAMHAGFRSGGVFTTVLIVIYALVMVSGVALWWLQRRGAAQATISPSRVESLRLELVRHVRELIERVAGEAADDSSEAADVRRSAQEHIRLTTDRTASRLQGQVVQLHMQRTPLPDGERLRAFCSEVIAPFLDETPPASSPLLNVSRARREFDSLRSHFNPQLAAAIDQLEDCCNQRRDLLQVERDRVWMELCSLIHTPLTAALVVLTIAHAVVAWQFR